MAAQPDPRAAAGDDGRSLDSLHTPAPPPLPGIPNWPAEGGVEALSGSRYGPPPRVPRRRGRPYTRRVAEQVAAIGAGGQPVGRTRAIGGRFRSPRLRARGLLLLRASAVAAVVAGALDFVIAPLQGRFAGQFEDYQDYVAAARAVTQHTDVYATFLNHIQPIPVQGFDYPPVIAWLLQPLTWLPSGDAATVWLMVVLACSIAGTAIVAYELLPAPWPRLELTVLFSFLYAPVTYNLWHGQMSAVVYLFLALALRSWLRERQVSLGVFIGIAACIKLAPILLMVLLLRRRWWKACWALAGTLALGIGVSVVALGIGTVREYVTHVLPVLAWQNGWVYNQSAAGAVNRLLNHSVLAFQPSSVFISAVTIAIAVAAIGIAALLVRTGDRSREMRGAEFALVIMAMLLAGSVTWFWHLGALLIVLAAVAGLTATRVVRRPRRLAVAGLAVILTTGVLAPLLIASASMSRLTALSHSWLWWPALQVISTPAFTIAALFVVLALEVRTVPIRARQSAQD